MTLRHATPNTPLMIPAADWNQIVDAARRSRDVTAQPKISIPPRSINVAQQSLIKIKNTAAAAVDRFGVLGISGAIFDPYVSSDALPQFLQQPGLTGTTPDASHAGKFVVAIEPIASQGIGWACISGIVQVQVNMVSASHVYADVTASDATKLTSGSSGARIVWVSAGTGTKWAIVDMSRMASMMQFAKVVAMFKADGAAWTDWPTDRAYAAFCTAQPCDSAGGNVQTSQTVYVGLNTNATSPIGLVTSATQIIGYMPVDGKKTYTATPITLAGQAVLGFGCWMDYARYR